MIVVVIFALIAHVAYATNDFSGALGARKFDGKFMSLFGWATGTAIFTLLAPFFLHLKLSLAPLLVIGLLAFMYAVSYPIFLKAIEKGNATISGVIAGSFPLWTVLTSMLLYNEKLTKPEVLAVAIILTGVILSALHLTKKTRFHNLLNRYTLFAFIVSLIWGIGFALWKYPVKKLGWFETSYFDNILATAITYGLFYKHYKVGLKKAYRKYYFYPLLNASTGVIGTLTYSYALTRGNPSIIAPIAGSYSGLYAILSYIKFKETLTKIQILGVVIILIGIILLSVIVART